MLHPRCCCFGEGASSAAHANHFIPHTHFHASEKQSREKQRRRRRTDLILKVLSASIAFAILLCLQSSRSLFHQPDTQHAPHTPFVARARRNGFAKDANANRCAFGRIKRCISCTLMRWCHVHYSSAIMAHLIHASLCTPVVFLCTW